MGQPLRSLRQHFRSDAAGQGQAFFFPPLFARSVRSLGFAETHQHAVFLARETFRGGLPRGLLECSHGAEQTKTGIRTTRPLTHEEIGDCIGGSRETVTRTFTDFQSRLIGQLWRK